MLNLKSFLMPKLERFFSALAARRIYDTSCIAALAFVYYGMAVWGLKLAFHQTNSSPIWPPSGIAFTALLIFGYRLWPGVWLGAFLANITVFMANHFADFPTIFLTSFLIAIGNTLEAVLGVFLISSFVGSRNPLFKTRDIFQFVFVALTATLASATVGTIAVSSAKHFPWPIFQVVWYTWWLGDVLSILILTSFLLVLYKTSLKAWPLRRILEAAVLLIIFVGIDAVIFGTKFFSNEYHFPTIYLILPLMVWSTYRFSHWGTTVASMITLLFGLHGTTNGLGPFFSSDLNFSLLSLQVFIGILTVTGLVLAAALYERQQAEEARLHLAFIVENSDEAIIGKSLEGIITSWNKGARRLYGYAQQEIVGKSVDILVPAQKKEELAGILRQIKQGHKIEQLETLRLNKDGRLIDVLLTVSPIRDAGGHLMGASAITHDITERKLFEEVLKRDKESLKILVDERSKELLNTQKELKKATRLADIGTLAATVAHELRNPLGVIQMAAYNIKRKRQNPAEDKHLINIEKKVWEGNRIIDNLLSYSRIKTPLYQKVPLFNVLDECVSSAQSRFQDHNVTVVKEYEREHIDTIEADPDQIKEIFINILNNAYQAFPHKIGTIEVIVRRDQKNQVSIVFKDNGMGIDEEDLDKVFSPFFTRKSKGTGLGLTICNELVDLHHGKIIVESRKQEGTSVNVILPITRGDHE